MAITLANAVSEVRSLLNEPTAVFWTDSEIQTWLQEGTRITASKTLCVQGSDTITLVEGQLTYTSSGHSWIGDCLEPYAVIYYDTSSYHGLRLIHPKQLGNVMTFTAGDPKYYSFHARTFYVWPLPSAGVDGRTLTVLYAAETDDITDLRDEYQNLPITWALSKAKMKDQKFAEAAALQAQFFSEISFERQDKVVRPGETEENVKTGSSTSR